MVPSMSKVRTVHRCQACGACQLRWAGRCPSCGEWGSLQEELETTAPGGGPGPVLGTRSIAVVALHDVDPQGHPPMPSGLAEVDRVLAGGLVPGSATLLGGEPGTGKSTLLLQVLASMASSGKRCLLVAAEESAHQVRRRATRLGADVPGVLVVEASELSAVEAAIANVAVDVVVVDSVQAISDAGGNSAAGSPAQVRTSAHRLVSLAKSLGSALVLVGHVTKDGSLAGPRALEHLVDTVLSFEGDRYSALRALRSVKHRFGPAGETGLFEMGEAGLVGVPDPSGLFLGDRVAGVAGSAVAVPVEGHRPLLVEVQALVGRSSQAPRRYVTGLDAGRVGFLVAVLERHAGLVVGDRDVYVSVAGGARACEPAADLAACLALASCLKETPVPDGIVAIGEVGLGGEVRRVSAMQKRLSEASRLGFSAALVPAQAPGSPASPAPRSPAPRSHGCLGAHPAGSARSGAGISQLPAATLREALSAALGDLTGRGGPRYSARRAARPSAGGSGPPHQRTHPPRPGLRLVPAVPAPTSR